MCGEIDTPIVVTDASESVAPLLIISYYEKMCMTEVYLLCYASTMPLLCPLCLHDIAFDCLSAALHSFEILHSLILK